MSGPATVCLPAVRMLHDRLGPARAAGVLRRLAEQGPSFRLVGRHAAEGWPDALEGIDSWRRAGTHLHATTRLAPGVTIGDGMLISPPGSMPVETLAQAAIGRPATYLVDHPALDASMLVTGIGTSDTMQCWATVSNARTSVQDAMMALDAGVRP